MGEDRGTRRRRVTTGSFLSVMRFNKDNIKKAPGPVLAALVLFILLPCPPAFAKVPSHLGFMASTLYEELEKTLEEVPGDTKHGNILKDSQKILKKSYIDKWSAKEFSSKAVKIREELEKALEVPKLTNEEMQAFLSPDFYTRKVEVIKALYAKRDKRLSDEDKFFDIAENVAKALGKRWEGMETKYTIEPADHSRVVLDWDPQRSDFKMLVEQDAQGDREGFETLLRGEVEAAYDPDTGVSEFSLEPSEDAVQPLDEEEKRARDKVIEASIWGEWLSERGDTWVFSSVNEKAHGAVMAKDATQEENALSSLSAKKAKLTELKSRKLYIWKNGKTGETISQKKFKKLKDDDFEYQGQDYKPETAQMIKKLEEEISSLSEETGKDSPIDNHDPVDFGEMLGQGPLTITVTDKDGYSFTYDEAYHDKGVIRARRTLRDMRDITNLPETIVRQLITSWSPPEWIEIKVEYDYASERMVMNVDRFRLHVTYDGWSMEVGSIHTPYKYVWSLKRAEEFDPIALRFLDESGKEITGEVPYDEPIQIEVEFDEPQNSDKRMVRLSWGGEGRGLHWVEVKATRNRKIFRSDPLTFVPPETGEMADDKLKL